MSGEIELDLDVNLGSSVSTLDLHEVLENENTNDDNESPRPKPQQQEHHHNENHHHHHHHHHEQNKVFQGDFDKIMSRLNVFEESTSEKQHHTNDDDDDDDDDDEDLFSFLPQEHQKRYKMLQHQQQQQYSQEAITDENESTFTINTNGDVSPLTNLFDDLQSHRRDHSPKKSKSVSHSSPNFRPSRAEKLNTETPRNQNKNNNNNNHNNHNNSSPRHDREEDSMLVRVALRRIATADMKSRLVVPNEDFSNALLVHQHSSNSAANLLMNCDSNTKKTKKNQNASGEPVSAVSWFQDENFKPIEISSPSFNTAATAATNDEKGEMEQESSYANLLSDLRLISIFEHTEESTRQIIVEAEKSQFDLSFKLFESEHKYLVLLMKMMMTQATTTTTTTTAISSSSNSNQQQQEINENEVEVHPPSTRAASEISVDGVLDSNGKSASNPFSKLSFKSRFGKAKDFGDKLSQLNHLFNEQQQNSSCPSTARCSTSSNARSNSCVRFNNDENDGNNKNNNKNNEEKMLDETTTTQSATSSTSRPSSGQQNNNWECLLIGEDYFDDASSSSASSTTKTNVFGSAKMPSSGIPIVKNPRAWRY
jgi:hypothetical protein